MSQSGSPPDIRTLEITGLAFGGDGMARDAATGNTVFVPYALPGDTVQVKITETRERQTWAKILEVVAPSPERVAPPCLHALECGGCALQHWRIDAYQAWKVQSVLDRLMGAHLHPARLHPLVAIPPATRRRATFCARRAGGRVVLGFNRHHSDQVIDLRECHVVVPEIARMLPSLRMLMDVLLADVRSADVGVTQLDTGLDILITGDITLNLLMREALAEFVAGHEVARVSLRAHERAETEVVLQPKSTLLSVGGVLIDPAPGSFLQPSREGERALIRAVQQGVGQGTKIVDLFSGLGTFTLPLARAGARVHAVDVDGPGIRAMAAAVARDGLNITHQARNLYKDPVRAADLAPYDTIVFDPPRAGAKAQAREIAAAGVPCVVAVSCNPGTFAIDCAPLRAQGYNFTELTVVDQFIWSSHVEIVGVFRRG